MEQLHARDKELVEGRPEAQPEPATPEPAKTKPTPPEPAKESDLSRSYEQMFNDAARPPPDRER